MARCYIIAEAGVNHNGSEDIAMRLIDAAVVARVDAVKFQTFKTEKIVTASAKKAAYQEAQTGSGGQHEMLKALELSDAAHRRLAAYCRKRGVEFLSTPFDKESADFLIELGCKRFKVASGELTNTPFLEYLAAKGMPMILSTGMATFDEVAEAVALIARVREQQGFVEPLAKMLTLLHCTTSYPTPLVDVNLRAMQTLRDSFNLPVGYSDHTSGIFVAPIARALGAEMFEKHFTVDRNLPGPDHAASIEPDELIEMVRAIRDTDIVLGSAEKRPSASELDVRIVVRRSVTLAQDVNAGVPLEPDMLTLLRPGDGIPPDKLEQVIGHSLKVAMSQGDTLHWEDLSE